MKLQFNLLPDVKQQYLKTQRTKRMVITASAATATISLVLLLFMMTTVYVVNKKQLSDANKDVEKYSSQLKNIPNLDKILTVQHQLDSLKTLHQNKHLTSRLYTYLPQVTPVNVHMTNVTVDLTANTMSIQGTTDSQKTINTFIDTLKFTTYKTGETDTKTKAFPSVIESQFSLGDKGANYQLTIQFDPVLFAGAGEVSLNVPAGLSTTRSVLNDPSNTLFDGETGQTKTTTPASPTSGGSQ